MPVYQFSKVFDKSFRDWFHSCFHPRPGKGGAFKKKRNIKSKMRLSCNKSLEIEDVLCISTSTSRIFSIGVNKDYKYIYSFPKESNEQLDFGFFDKISFLASVDNLSGLNFFVKKAARIYPELPTEPNMDVSNVMDLSEQVPKRHGWHGVSQLGLGRSCG
eukprot:GHVP01037386.1.p1 GENE.GHVP01037386.1~~GHVP01037386.1.p1  ORF type:complete len:160 (+),score=19.77 GHVP01037386.1:352-831(+)